MNEAKEFERRLRVRLAEQQRAQVLPAWSLVTATVVGVYLVLVSTQPSAHESPAQWMFLGWLGLAWTGTLTLLLLGLIPPFANLRILALLGLSAGVIAEACLLVYSPSVAASPWAFAILALPLGVAAAWALRLHGRRVAAILVVVPIVALVLGVQARLIQ